MSRSSWVRDRGGQPFEHFSVTTTIQGPSLIIALVMGHADGVDRIYRLATAMPGATPIAVDREAIALSDITSAHITSRLFTFTEFLIEDFDVFRNAPRVDGPVGGMQLLGNDLEMIRQCVQPPAHLVWIDTPIPVYADRSGKSWHLFHNPDFSFLLCSIFSSLKNPKY